VGLVLARFKLSPLGVREIEGIMREGPVAPLTRVVRSCPIYWALSAP
jgi:hypothetical protein